MTSSSEQPPKEYIIDADTLATFGDYFLSAVNGDEDKTKLLQLWKSNLSVATSRPHSSPTLLEIAKQYENIPPTIQQIKIEAARKAREDFAKGLIELFKGFEDQHVLRYSPHEMAEYVETFEKHISLRSTTPHTEQEGRAG